MGRMARMRGSNAMNAENQLEIERIIFESLFAVMGFDLRRAQPITAEPWDEYQSDATGYAWTGWMAARGIRS